MRLAGNSLEGETKLKARRLQSVMVKGKQTPTAVTCPTCQVTFACTRCHPRCEAQAHICPVCDRLVTRDYCDEQRDDRYDREVYTDTPKGRKALDKWAKRFAEEN